MYGLNGGRNTLTAADRKNLRALMNPRMASRHSREGLTDAEPAGSEETWSEKDLRAYQVIGKSLLERIRSGEFRSSGKLPTERDLAEIYGVGRAVIRDALVMLEVKGAVQSRQGSGIYIMPQAYAQGVNVEASDGFATGELAVAQLNPQHLIDAHQWLDCQIARITATRHSEDDMAAMEKALQMLVNTSADEEYEPRNHQFHRQIAQATHNYEFVFMSEQAWQRRQQSPALRNLSVLLYGDRFRSVVFADHQRTLDFLHRGDGDGAFYSMWHHYENLKTALTLSESLPAIQG